MFLVLDTLVLIGEIVVSLDLKTMAEHWKGFIKLLQQNADNLQTVFSIEKPLSFLAANIENILKGITNPVCINVLPFRGFLLSVFI